MKIEEVENLLPLFEGAVETRRIKRKSLKNWLVNYLVHIALYFIISPTHVYRDSLEKDYIHVT